ncbi:MAG: hydrogenase iron-sulfur subunit [Acidobacteria bacterium]|nr:hydrogenase iron-sulfur subunit [Acidobacteriota bacterium]
MTRIVAFVCNWCTYLGADLAGTNRLEYPADVRLIRLPCTGRIDFNLVVKAFEVGAGAVLVSGCHPGDCHYSAGNYHARRRWMLFRPLLEALGYDLRRVHFTWISAAEGKKFQQVITEITEKTRELGPAKLFETNGGSKWNAPPAPEPCSWSLEEDRMRATARKLLEDGTAKVVIGHGARGPVFVTRPEEADRLVWNEGCVHNLTTYLKRKEIRALGAPAIVVKKCDERALVVLEQESQISREDIHVVAMPCQGMNQPKCRNCEDDSGRYGDLESFLALSREDRMAYWAVELDRCVKCYACRQVCPLCYCERCVADKNRPRVIGTSATLKDNFAWHITRAFHQAGRCIGCDECTRACPAGIHLRLLNLATAKAAEDCFGYRAGYDPAAEPVLGAWSLQDKEDFIR